MATTHSSNDNGAGRSAGNQQATASGNSTKQYTGQYKLVARGDGVVYAIGGSSAGGSDGSPW